MRPAVLLGMTPPVRSDLPSARAWALVHVRGAGAGAGRRSRSTVEIIRGDKRAQETVRQEQ